MDAPWNHFGNGFVLPSKCPATSGPCFPSLCFIIMALHRPWSIMTSTWDPTVNKFGSTALVLCIGRSDCGTALLFTGWEVRLVWLICGWSVVDLAWCCQHVMLGYTEHAESLVIGNQQADRYLCCFGDLWVTCGWHVDELWMTCAWFVGDMHMRCV